MTDQSFTLLFVEDNPGDVRLLREALAAAGSGSFHLVHVLRLGDALERLGRESFDAIMLDLSLPDSQGEETLVRLQQAAAGVPVVVLTGLEDEALGVRLVQAGAQDYLVKGQDGSLHARRLRLAIERKRAEEALRESEERFRAFAESASEAIVAARGGEIILWNGGAERLFLRSEEEALGQPVSILIPEPFLTKHREAVARLHATGELRHIGTGALEARGLRKDGTEVPVEISLSAWDTAKGRCFGAIIRDISERKRAEQDARAAEVRYRQIVESLNVIVWRADAQPVRFTFVSPEAETILGYPAACWTEEASFWQDHIHPEDRDFAVSFCRKATEELRDHQFEYRMLAADGRTVWLQDVVHVVAVDGRPTELVGVMIDVSERKRLEAQLRQSQKMEAIGQLAGGIAHDFNNLLGVITGYAEMLIKDLAPQHPGQRRVEQVLKAAEKAAGLTRQLLAFSRKQVLQPKVLDLNSVVAEIEKMLRRVIGEDVQLVTVFSAGLGRVKADPGQMEQVIVNLAVNARDAMPRGGRLIIETANADLDEDYARAHAGARAGPHVLLAVSDTGHGMDAETLSHIFEPFFTTKDPGKGTGLGLATVYGIVEQSRGYISVYSEPGRGSTFKIYLPRIGEGAELSRPAAAPAEAAARGSETILLVEDDAPLRDMIREVLEAGGYTVLQGSTPEESLSAGVSHPGPLHVMLTDVVMPRISGPEIADRLRSVRPEVKVLFMSGYTGEAIGHHGVLDVDTRFIQKPFTSEALLRKVREILDERECLRKDSA